RRHPLLDPLDELARAGIIRRRLLESALSVDEGALILMLLRVEEGERVRDLRIARIHLLGLEEGLLGRAEAPELLERQTVVVVHARAIGQQSSRFSQRIGRFRESSALREQEAERV